MIRFEGVTKTYPGTSRPALNGVDLEVLKGEFVFLVGASGSGKSSFLRLVLKEDRPTKGKIFVLGQELAAISSGKVPYFRRSLGVVFQDFRLLPNKTVFDNVAFTLQVIGKSKGFIQEAVPDVLKMVGLGGKQNRYPHELSGGEQQRVAIARAVVNKPAIMLADEPTGNLDPATSAGIMTLLATINANGTTVLMATHDVGIVDSMKRRVIELVGGQIVRDERQGGYQTQSMPMQKVRKAEPSFDDLAAAVPTPQPTPTPTPAVAPSTAVPITVEEVAPTTDPIDVILAPAAATDDQPPADATEPAEATPASAPPVAPTTRRPAVIPEPGSGPPPGFVWPKAPDSLRSDR
ncbi:cell division ATP-binding protein FtsE [Pseudolysinimonas sp.]|jgi:cell division transport system ATP-binding protein|uniref:cell division ATP-binding protein FtsE n=1 Tax=Pseudolysinimonas sp. TaxID=2680009 RepID=UPI0037833D91